MSDKPLSFAAAYQELQQLTHEFETEDMDLELAIPKFKRAAELAKFLKKRLSELENQIEEINLSLEKDLEATKSEPESEPGLPEDNGSDDIPF